MFGLNPLSSKPFASVTVSQTNLTTTAIANTVTITKAIGKLLNISVTKTIAIVKAIAKTLPTILETTVEIINGLASHFITLVASVSSSINITKAISKLITAAITEVVALIETANHVIQLLASVTTIVTITNAISKILSTVQSSLVTITKDISTTISTIVSPIISLVKDVFTTLTTSVSNIADLTAYRTVVVFLSTALTATVDMSRFIRKYLTIVPISAIIIGKSLSKTIRVLSTIIPNLYAGVISFAKYANNKVIYAQAGLRSLSSVKFIRLVGTLQRVREVTLIKLNDLFKNKGPSV